MHHLGWTSTLGAVRRFTQRETVLTAATLGAVATMFFVPPDAAYGEYMDWKVLSCLFCLMAVVEGLRRGGVFEMLATSVLKIAGNLRSLGAWLVMMTFFLSMGITNDVALISLVPFALILLKDLSRPVHRMHIITLQTIAANIGSSLTPVGNPQNLYLFSFFHLEPLEFFAIILPVVAAGGFVLLLSLMVIPAQPVERKTFVPVSAAPGYRNILYGLLFILSVLAVFRVLPYRLTTGLVILGILLMDRSLFCKIDYSLLCTFTAFFIAIGNLQRIGSVKEMLSTLVSQYTFGTSVIASQAISNVPAAILLSPFTDDATSLLRGVSVGGMGTLIASLASVISYKLYIREHPQEGLAYLRIFTLWNAAYVGILSAFCILIG